MALTLDFQGKLLISLTDGKKLGEIKDVYLDQQASRLVAVYLGKSGLINRKAQVIDMPLIKLMGVDAWLVTDSETVVVLNEIENSETFLLADSLRGREIQTDGGTKIGTVGDIYVDDNCNVKGFVFDKLLVEGPLSETRAISREAISSLGDEKSPMIAALDQAEKLKVEIE
ncbi:MAG: PRC-barrel domain-containing protein [Blastocatellales bacterium]